MSVFDGSDDELTYAEALLAIAERVSWGTEHQKIAAMRAIQREFDMVPPEPAVPTHLQDSRDITLRNQDTELAELRKRLDAAELRKQVAEAERDAVQAEADSARTAQVTPAAWADKASADTETAKSAETSTGGKKKT